jgi:glutathione S-transferase
MALHEKKLPYKEHIINLIKGEQYQPWFLRINPRGEVPVLKDGVKVIPDSGRILDYLEDNFSNGLYILCCGIFCGNTASIQNIASGKQCISWLRL